MKKKRDSNIELLRIVCMLFIIIHHFIVHGIGYVGMSHDEIVDLDKTYLLVNSFVIIAVDCFILISGYYGIKPSLNGLLRLYLICVFYNLCSYCITPIVYTGDNVYSLHGCFMPFSHSNGLWFIPTYSYLFILSPLLNRYWENISSKGAYTSIFIMGILIFYFGYFWNAHISPTGYDLMNFIFLYFWGRCLRLYHESRFKKQWPLVLGYLVFTMLTWGISLYQETSLAMAFPLSAFKYNSPLVIGSAICFFLIFRNFTISNSRINWLASSSLAIYLITECHNNSNLYIKLSNYVFNHYDSTATVILLYVALALLLALICILIDKLRIILFTPFEVRIIRIGEMFFEKIKNKIK